MLNVRILEDSVEIDGYVNAIERKSKILEDRSGAFTERICKGAFGRALERADDVRILLNHDENRDLGGVKDGNLELTEDPIGLRAHAIIRDGEVIDKARNDELVGWSFGFYDREVEYAIEDGIVSRAVMDMDLEEVSLLDKSKIPAYDGTLVTVRESDGKRLKYGAILTRDDSPAQEPETADIAVSEPTEPEPETAIDYTEYDELINDMKGDWKNV